MRTYSLYLFPLFLILLTFSCNDIQITDSTKDNNTVPKGMFMGIEATAEPKLMFPDFINTQMGEYNGTFNADGTEFFYTVSNIYHNTLVQTVLDEFGHWGNPTISEFSVKHDEFDPIFAPDGQTLYFSSHRPTTDRGSTNYSNIWKVEKTDEGWGVPRHIPLLGPDKGNYFSSLTEKGVIYFNIWNTGNMYKAIPVDTGYVVEDLGEIINSKHGDGDPFIAPDESYLIFRSTREGGFGNGDLWISFSMENQWTEPINLGEPINSKYHEMCPNVTSDGKLFIFSSGRFSETYYADKINTLSDVKSKLKTWDNGQQNIYTMSASFIDDLRKELLLSK